MNVKFLLPIVLSLVLGSVSAADSVVDRQFSPDLGSVRHQGFVGRKVETTVCDLQSAADADDATNAFSVWF